MDGERKGECRLKSDTNRNQATGSTLLMNCDDGISVELTLNPTATNLRDSFYIKGSDRRSPYRFHSGFIDFFNCILLKFLNDIFCNLVFD